ncbi:MAG: hypothetical protein IKP44_03345 [Bacteroidaceae bacterium]|nr:hypothetical protein [Bacteroidaceae bacterium]
MCIVQTFWTAGQDPLKHAFGWLHPEYNLMSWTLSCLSLREHYDEVALYTDSEGKRILIDELHLPYTEVNVVFDDFPCLPQHWALAKIKTYSLQTQPFLHVDGDVYVPHPIPEVIFQAPLIAQNREIGTRYYRAMMDRLLKYSSLWLPEYIEKGLHEESVVSYNMGFLGGTDLDFICRYCQEVFGFMEKNRMNDPACPHSKVDCNVFFEQVIFAMMADRENRTVASVLGRCMQDEGYTRGEFCDLDYYGEKPFYHILGGHKRSQAVCEMMSQAMLRLYPEHYRKILSLCSIRHHRLNKNVIYLRDMMTAQQSLAQYEDFLTEKEKEWKDLDVEELFQMEKEIAGFVRFTKMDGEEMRDLTLKACPWFSIFHIPQNWNPWAAMQLKEKFGCEKEYPLTMVAVMPCLQGRGLRESPLLDMGQRIFTLLQKRSMTFGELQDEIVGSFCLKSREASKGACRHIMHEVRELLKNGIIIGLRS